MTNYTQYAVIERENLDELVRAVDQAINKGWQPLGGVAVSGPLHRGIIVHFYYYQAMVVEEEVEE